MQLSVLYLGLVLVFSLSSGYSDTLARDQKNRYDYLDLAKVSSEKNSAWAIEMSNRLSKWLSDETIRKHILDTIQYEASLNNLDPQLVLSIITVESKFNKYAVSHAGAIGLMQIMPFWLKEKKHPNNNLFDIDTNIHLGCIILREYLNKEQGNLFYALGRYNGSRGKSQYPELILDTYNKYWQLVTA